MKDKKEFDASNIILYEILSNHREMKFNLTHYLHLQIVEVTEYREVLSETFGYDVKMVGH